MLVRAESRQGVRGVIGERGPWCTGYGEGAVVRPQTPGPGGRGFPKKASDELPSSGCPGP
eukprot:14631222-Alexandrium_andersonii.AAC.1